MNRRTFIQLLLTEIIGFELDTDKLLWKSGQKTIFIPSDSQILDLNNFWKPHPAQIKFIEQIDENIKLWSGIVRSTTPWPFREVLKRVCLDPNKPLYIIGEKKNESD